MHAVGDRALLARRARDRGELEEQIEDLGPRRRMLRSMACRRLATRGRRLSDAAVDSRGRGARRARARARRATNSRKSGAGRVGRDLNSGWNCDATNHGWSGSSTISTRRPSWNVPLTTSPPSTSCCR